MPGDRSTPIHRVHSVHSVNSATSTEALTPPSSTGRLREHTVAKTIGNLRDVGNALLTGEGAAAFGKSDSAWTKATKVAGLAHQVVWWNAWHNHLSHGRTMAGLKYWGSSVNEMGKKVPLGKLGELGPIATESAKTSAGVFGFLNGAIFLKRSYDLAFDAACDLLTLSERKELFDLLEHYNPVTHRFIEGGISMSDSVKEARINELLQKKLTARTKEGGSYLRSPGQRALDWGAKAKDVMLSGYAGVASNIAVPFGQSFILTNTLSCVGYSVNAANHWGRFALQTANLNNIRHAEKKASQYRVSQPDNEAIFALHQSVAKHMRQERVYTARGNGANGLAATAGAVANGLALTAFAPAAVGVMIGSGALLAGVGTATVAFNMVHGRTLLKRREAGATAYADTSKAIAGMSATEKTHYYESLGGKKKIGEAEWMLLRALRQGTDQEKEATVEFLRNVGISAKTIKVIMQTPDEKAAHGALINQLHTARLHIKGSNLVYLGNSVSWILGIGYFKEWLATRKESKAAIGELRHLHGIT